MTRFRRDGPAFTESDLRGWCDEVGNCLIWRRGTNNSGAPVVWRDGQARPVRREIWTLNRGTPARRGYVVVPCCRERLCVNPKHLTMLSRSQWVKRLGEMGNLSKPDGLAKRIAASRSKPGNRLNMDKAREIRRLESEGMRPFLIARQFGVSRELVDHVTKGRTWRELSVQGASVFSFRP